MEAAVALLGIFSFKIQLLIHSFQTHGILAKLSYFPGADVVSIFLSSSNRK